MRSDDDLRYEKVMVVQNLRLELRWGYFVMMIRRC